MCLCSPCCGAWPLEAQHNCSLYPFLHVLITPSSWFSFRSHGHVWEAALPQIPGVRSKLWWGWLQDIRRGGSSLHHHAWGLSTFWSGPGCNWLHRSCAGTLPHRWVSDWLESMSCFEVQFTHLAISNRLLSNYVTILHPLVLTATLFWMKRMIVQCPIKPDSWVMGVGGETAREIPITQCVDSFFFPRQWALGKQSSPSVHPRTFPLTLPVSTCYSIDLECSSHVYLSFSFLQLLG